MEPTATPFDLCMEACDEFGWYNRNTAFNPYMTEGKKTVVFELAEQLGLIENGRRGSGKLPPTPLWCR